MLSNISSACLISFIATPGCPPLIAFNRSKSSAAIQPLPFFRFRLAFNRVVDFTAPRWVPCEKRKLACCNFNALILETGTNRHNLTLEFSHTINQNLTRRHAEQAQVKLVRSIYLSRHKGNNIMFRIKMSIK